jgi:excisionase family DNA binding protein
MMIINGQKFVTEKEVSTHFGMSISWIRKLRYESNLPYHKLKRKVLFNESEVDTWLKDNLKAN